MKNVNSQSCRLCQVYMLLLCLYALAISLVLLGALIRRLKKLNVMTMDRARLFVRECIIIHNFVLVHDCAAADPVEPEDRVLPVYNKARSKPEAISRFLMTNDDVG